MIVIDVSNNLDEMKMGIIHIKSDNFPFSRFCFGNEENSAFRMFQRELFSIVNPHYKKCS